MQALDTMLVNDPTKFCQMVSQIIPKDFQVSVDDGTNVRWVINATPLSVEEWQDKHGLGNVLEHDPD